MNYPTCPTKTLLPRFIETSVATNPNRYYIIVPGPQHSTRLDFPLVKPYIRPNLNLTQPVYHNGFIIMQAKHHGMPAQEIETDLFEFISDGAVENSTPKSIIRNGDIFKIFKACQTAPLMLDIVDRDKLAMYFKGKLPLRPYDLLSHIVNHQSFKLPKAYLINLVARTDRLRRVSARLEQHNIEYTVIEAIPKDDHFITFKSLYADNINQGRRFDRRAQFACYYSHLKAIKAFYESGDPMAFIFEDDAAFRKDFSKRIPSVISRLHSMGDFRICSLIITNEDFYKEYSRDAEYPEMTELIKLDNRSWGLVGYIISRQHAAHCLEKFDKPILECATIPGMPDYVTSEVIPMYSHGWATSVALVIDEMGPSNIAAEGPAFHRQIYGFHGLENFDIPENYD